MSNTTNVRRFPILAALISAAALTGVGLWVWKSNEGKSQSAGTASGAGKSSIEVSPGGTSRKDVPTLTGRFGPDGEQMTEEAKAEGDRISAALAAVPPIQPGEIENEVAMDLLRRWVAIDPVSAIQYAARHPDLHGRADFPGELLTLWLDQKGDVAKAWVISLQKGELRSQLLPTVISLVAESDPTGALKMASDLTGDARKNALSALFTEWASVDPAAAAEQAGKLSTNKEQNQAMRDVLGKWADVDLKAAVDWAKRLPASPTPDSVDIFPEVIEAVLEKWTAQSAEEAAKHVVSTPAGSRRIQMMSAVAGQWAVQDPKAAIEWASKVTVEEDRNVFVRGVLAGVAQSNVQAAADLVLSLPSGAAQKTGMEMILGQWTAGNPAAVATWAASQFQNNDQGARLASIVAAWAGSEPKSLGNWLNTLPPGESRDVCCGAMARHLATTYPEIAAEWAGTIANPQVRQQQLEAVHRLSGTTGSK